MAISLYVSTEYQVVSDYVDAPDLQTDPSWPLMVSKAEAEIPISARSGGFLSSLAGLLEISSSLLETAHPYPPASPKPR